MSDNPQVRAGTAGGTITVAADEITSPYTGGAAQAQAVKLLDGTADGTTPAKVTASGELVTFVGNQGTVTVASSGLPAGAATLAEQQTQTASLSVLDDWDETDRAKVNPIVGQAGVQAGAGAASANTQRVTVATDDVVKMAGTVVTTLPAGDNTVGRVKITDGTDVADVLDLSNSNPLVVAVVDDNGNQVTSFGGGSGGVQYTEGDTDATLTGGVVMIEESGDTVRAVSAGHPMPVAGTVAASFAGTALVKLAEAGTVVVSSAPTTTVQATNLDIRDLTSASDSVAAVQSGAWNVGGTVIVSSITNALPAGTNAIGKLAANSGVDIGDVDVTSVPADPFGANADAAVAAGATGSIQAKLRRISSDIDAIKTAVETIDNVVAGSEAQVDVVTMPTTTVQATNLDIRDLTSASDSVAAAQSGAWNVGGTITKGSAVMGLGYTLGGTQITLTASGTVIAAVASKTLYVTHEAFTVQGGTVTITARNGNGGGTLWGPMQFSPTGGMAVSAPLEQGGLFQTVSGSAVYYELVGSGTVGGRIRWAVA